MNDTRSSRFGDMPGSRRPWWSMAFGLGALAILFVRAIVTDWDPSIGDLNVLPALALGLGLAALVTGLAAYRDGERTWVLWIGLGPGILLALLLIAELTFME